jgi:hypothetical protein
MIGRYWVGRVLDAAEDHFTVRLLVVSTLPLTLIPFSIASFLRLLGAGTEFLTK